MDIYLVSPKKVIIPPKVDGKAVFRQIRRLEQEGQIEPIPVKPAENGQFTLNQDHPDYWVYSPEQVKAAILLEWDTILVTY